ncbi:MAG: PD40 domain-containing protein [Ferruginibacter sp.]|nr:PD40 domain-containing protein [Ferruginibacter sp.]
MRIKNIITAGLVTSLFSFKAYTQTPQGLQYFKQHGEILLKDGGKWKSVNQKYDASDSSSASYFGWEFSKGINDNTLRFKSTAYVPKKSEWKILSEGYFTWDAKKQKIVCMAVNASTGVVNAESENIFESGWIMKELGEKQKVQLKIADNSLEATDYKMKNNRWQAKPPINFSRLEQPSGNLTFMSTRDGNFEIYSMDAKGENLKNLSCNKAVDYAFSYADDGRLAFYTNRDGNDEIYVMDADGKKQTNITNNPASDRIPAFSPDGKQIVFVSDREDKRVELYIMDADGKNLRRLTNNEYFEDAGGFSPDGKKIIFSRELKDLNDTSRKAVGNGEIFIMDADGSNEKQLTYRPGYDGGPQFSPDGTKIAFYGKTADGNYEIFLMDADGKNIINLTEDPLEDYSPSWSPDGKWIGYTNGNSKNYDAWIINLETKIKTRLTTQPKRDESPFWQPVKK